MKVIIMAGGRGTRFWPRSVEQKPKQFLAFASTKTMLQMTYDRFREWLPLHCIFVLAPKMYLDLVKEQLPELDESHIIIEPYQKDTGPCIGLAALRFLNKGDDDVLVTVASDHYIPDAQAFIRVIMKAEQVVHSTGSAVTIGIIPTRPDTGYGYIRACEMPGDNELLKVQEFIEKPLLTKARELIQNKYVYWNSGIVVWKPSIIGSYMARYQNAMWKVLNSIGDDFDQGYALLPKISVDYAILEKADNLYCIPANFEWDDLGSWKSLERIHTPDSDGNTKMGETHTFMTKNSIIYTEHQKAVVIGVEDLIIVSTSNGLLVCHKSKEDQIKKTLEGGGDPL